MVRFTEASGELPVIYVEVAGLENAPNVAQYLEGVEPLNEALSVSRTSPEEVTTCFQSSTTNSRLVRDNFRMVLRSMRVAPHPGR